MTSFIYDEYGYIVDGDKNEFEYQGYDFKLVAHDKTEEEVKVLQETLSNLKESMPFPISGNIVESRNHKLVVENEFGPVSLIAFKHQEYNPNAVFEMMRLGKDYKKQDKFTISDLIELWEEKIALIEEKYMEAISIDDYAYPVLNTETIYALGLANNAVAYLVDIKYDYGEEMNDLTMVHRRLNSLYAIDLFNPFNIVLDTQARDIAYLYGLGELNEYDVLKAIQSFQFSPKEVSLLVARLLFPTYTFDLLEDQYNIKKDIKKELLAKYKNSITVLKRISSLMNILVKQYSIRPIEWLLKI